MAFLGNTGQGSTWSKRGWRRIAILVTVPLAGVAAARLAAWHRARATEREAAQRWREGERAYAQLARRAQEEERQRLEDIFAQLELISRRYAGQDAGGPPQLVGLSLSNHSRFHLARLSGKLELWDAQGTPTGYMEFFLDDNVPPGRTRDFSTAKATLKIGATAFDVSRAKLTFVDANFGEE